MLRQVLAAIAGAALLVGGGCAHSPYVSGYTFYPQPAAAEVYHQVGTQEQTPVTVLASVLGVQRPDPDRRIPFAIVVRLRIENNGTAPVTFDPKSLELVTGMLRTFGPPDVRPPRQIDLAPGERQVVTATFPFPSNSDPGNFSLSALRLRWQLRVDGYPVPQAAVFVRSRPDYTYDSYDMDVSY